MRSVFSSTSSESEMSPVQGRHRANSEHGGCSGQKTGGRAAGHRPADLLRLAPAAARAPGKISADAAADGPRAGAGRGGRLCAPLLPPTCRALPYALPHCAPARMTASSLKAAPPLSHHACAHARFCG